MTPNDVDNIKTKWQNSMQEVLVTAYCDLSAIFLYDRRHKETIYPVMWDHFSVSDGHS